MARKGSNLGTAATTSSTLWKIPQPAREKKFLLSCQQLLLTVSTALRAIADEFLEYICTLVLFSELCSMAARDDWKWSTELERQMNRPGTRFDEYKVQERGQLGCHFGRTYIAEKSSYTSEPDSAALFVSPSVRTGPVVSSSSSPDTSMAALEQASRRWFRV